MAIIALNREGVCFLHTGKVRGLRARIQVLYAHTFLSELGCCRPRQRYNIVLKIRNDANQTLTESIPAKSYSEAMYIMHHIRHMPCECEIVKQVIDSFKDEESDTVSTDEDDVVDDFVTSTNFATVPDVTTEAANVADSSDDVTEKLKPDVVDTETLQEVDILLNEDANLEEIHNNDEQKSSDSDEETTDSEEETNTEIVAETVFELSSH